MCPGPALCSERPGAGSGSGCPPSSGISVRGAEQPFCCPARLRAGLCAFQRPWVCPSPSGRARSWTRGCSWLLRDRLHLPAGRSKRWGSCSSAAAAVQQGKGNCSHPCRYWKLDPSKVCATGPNAWDTAVHDASEEYKHRMVQLLPCPGGRERPQRLQGVPRDIWMPHPWKWSRPGWSKEL